MKLHLTIDTEDDELRQNVHSVTECSDRQAGFHSASYMTTVFATCLPKCDDHARGQIARSYELAGATGSVRPGRKLSWTL